MPALAWQLVRGSGKREFFAPTFERNAPAFRYGEPGVAADPPPMSLTPLALGLAGAVTLVCVFAPQSYLTGMIVDCILLHSLRRWLPTPAGNPG